MHIFQLKVIPIIPIESVSEVIPKHQVIKPCFENLEQSVNSLNIAFL